MESDEENLVFAPHEEVPSPIQQRKFKRLKKKARVSNAQRSLEVGFEREPKFQDIGKADDSIHRGPGSGNLDEGSEPKDLKYADVEKPVDSYGQIRGLGNWDDGSESNDSKYSDVAKPVDSICPSPGMGNLDDGSESASKFDDLFVYRGVSEYQKASNTEEGMELHDELDKGSDEEGELEIFKSGGLVDELKKEKFMKKRRSMGRGKEVERKKKKKVKSGDNDGEFEISERRKEMAKKKNKKLKSGNNDGEFEESERGKRKLEKERRAYLDLIHAESQRLLRETRDVSFKPVPVVQKPISSVLDKIRHRKLEVSKRSGIFDGYHSLGDSIMSLQEITQGSELHIENDVSRDAENAKQEDKLLNPVNAATTESSVANDDSSGSHLVRLESIPSTTASDQLHQDASQSPTDVEQGPLSQPELCNAEESKYEDHADSPPDADFTPSVLAMNLKLDPVPSEDSSGEEDYDKENIDPRSHKLADEGVYQTGDPVKAFVDDEAEEEDDSDNDLERFRESEDEEDNDENEELDGLIVTGYKEMPIDSEKRNQLHQEWLEQQDAAATDEVMQRLQCGLKHKDVSLLYNEEDEDKFDEDAMDESVGNHLSAQVARENSRKAKQMIAQVFNDEGDVFVSSDEEETEQQLVRQRLLEQNEEQTSFLSLTEDESSREVFGLIKKLNIAPTTKKKPKMTSSFFDTLVTGGNSNNSSKSSFLGRVASNSLPSSNKQGPSNFRSFIFGRDDSNSRSGISTSELSSEVELKETQTTRKVAMKCSSSQLRSIGHSKKNEAVDSSGSSLFEILRRSSMTSGHHAQNPVQNNTQMIGQSQAVFQFSAFKSVKKVVKMES